MTSLQEVHKEIYNSYLETASNIITHVEDSAQKDMLKRLTDLVEQNCVLDLKLKQSSQILKRMASQQHNSNADEGSQDILKQFKNELAGITTDVSLNKKFVEFQQQVQVFLDDVRPEEKDDADDELVLTQKQITVIDPITKKRIIDPVKNSVCGHVYDRGSVKALLEGNRQTRCPVVGCKNKNYILMENLRTDILTKRYLDTNPE